MLQHCSPISTTSDQESTRLYYWQQAPNELRNGPNTRCVSSEQPPGPLTTPDLGLLPILKLLVRPMMMPINNSFFANYLQVLELLDLGACSFAFVFLFL